MSFKRDEDDRSFLGNLRKRRIDELFGENIPEDEAMLLRNGKYTCLVCNHRPILDTVYMLVVHRQGKGHAASKELLMQKQKALQEEIQRRKHEQFLIDGTTSIQQASVYNRGLGLGAPYDPRVKKQKKHDRKITLDLCQKSQSSTPAATDVFDLPGNRRNRGSSWDNFPKDLNGENFHTSATNQKSVFDKNSNTFNENVKTDFVKVTKDPNQKNYNGNCRTTIDIVAEQMKGPVSHPKQLKKIFYKPVDIVGHVSPYVSKKNGIKVSDVEDVTTCNNVCKAQIHQKFGKLDKVVNSDAYNSVAVINNHEQNANVKCWNMCTEPPPPPPPLTPPEIPVVLSAAEKKPDFDHYSSVHTKNLHSKCYKNTANNGEKEQKTCKEDMLMNDDSKTKCLTLQEKKSKAEKYLHFRGAGWKKDLCGQWVKDEDAEFDSDEEPPDLP